MKETRGKRCERISRFARMSYWKWEESETEEVCGSESLSLFWIRAPVFQRYTFDFFYLNLIKNCLIFGSEK